jgi:hypothetical protein
MIIALTGGLPDPSVGAVVHCNGAFNLPIAVTAKFPKNALS